MTGASADLEEARRIVLDGLRGHRVEVYLFGSWARGSADRVSDIDIGVLPLDPLPPGVLPGIAEALETSTVLHPVDLVDLSRASAAFRQRVLEEGIRWSG